MFTTASGKSIDLSMSAEEQSLIDRLDIAPRQISRFRENYKAAQLFHSLHPWLSVSERVLRRFTEKTFANSAIEKILSGDYPAGAHYVFAVMDVPSSTTLLLTDFFRLITAYAPSGKFRLKRGDFVRVFGSQLVECKLLLARNGFSKCGIETPLRIDFFGRQKALPPFKPLKLLKPGDVPFLQLVVYRVVAGYWEIVTDEGRHFADEDGKEEALEILGPRIRRMEFKWRLIVTDPWSTAFFDLAQGETAEDSKLTEGDGVEVIAARCVLSKERNSLFTGTGSVVRKTGTKYFVGKPAPVDVCVDITIEQVYEVREGVFKVDQTMFELRLDFRPGTLNPRKLLARARAKLLRPGKKGLLSLREVEGVFYGNLLDTKIILL
jgi:hypothetical protein